MATQNDVPMAAKAHVLTKAFMGLEMKCARCHDAPYHPYEQGELFSVAAMLRREVLKLPTTSSVALSPDARPPAVTVSLRPGDTIAPNWPFGRLAPNALPDGVLRDANNPRERLAAILTSPRNDRFAQTIVNRLWHRYLGRGLVEPVDDWYEAEPSHPQLLEYLARELVTNGYDLKHVARLIFNSHTYQRRIDVQVDTRLFAAPSRRRLTAEQIVDSLFVVSGKPLRAEALTLDPEGRRSASTFLNLGVPSRAWQFTSLSNERDRPALALPIAQSIIDTLVTFGWRDSRPQPLTERDETATALQPLILANGIMARRIAQLSDDSAVTELAMVDMSLTSFVDELFLQVLCRPPAAAESDWVRELLADGYLQRHVKNALARLPAYRRTSVSWSNHLSPEATRIKLEMEQAAQAGDPSTERLETDWRERCEDVVWALVNSPEFVFVP